MTVVRLRRVRGGIAAKDWPRWGAELLELLVRLADPEVTGPAAERIYPMPTADLAESAEWRRNVHPELFSLVSSARDVVATDFSKSDRGARGEIRELVIPDAHRAAWISALQVARLRLASEYSLDAGTMRAPPDELPDALRGPVEIVDFYGWMQEMLLAADGEDDDGGAAGAGEPDAAGDAAKGRRRKSGGSPAGKKPAPKRKSSRKRRPGRGDGGAADPGSV